METWLRSIDTFLNMDKNYKLTAKILAPSGRLFLTGVGKRSQFVCVEMEHATKTFYRVQHSNPWTGERKDICMPRTSSLCAL